MKRAPTAMVGVILLLAAGCGSDGDDKVVAACTSFADAYADQKDVVSESGPREDYEEANARVGDALGKGAAAATGALKTAFTTTREGWQEDHDVGGLTDEGKLTALFTGYELVLTLCGETGADMDGE